MGTSVSNKNSSAPAAAPAEVPRAEPKKSDVVLTIKVILIALAFFAALWALDRFVAM